MGKNYRLVVGINGAIGSALFSSLKSNNIKNAIWGSTQRKAFNSQSNVFYLNLLDAPYIWQFPNLNFDVVYLCAGICRMASCEDDPQGTYKVNVDAMGELVRRLSNTGAYIVYLSTNQVFSGEESFVLSNANYKPINEYGRQKVEMEELIKRYCQSFAIVRLSKVMEPGMLLVKNWIESFVKSEPVEAFNDMILAPVPLRQVINVLTKLGDAKLNGCYQISGIEDISYYALARYLSNRLNTSSSLVRSISAIEKGIKKNFLPRFTTLDCSSTISMCGEKSLHYSEVLKECFNLL